MLSCVLLAERVFEDRLILSATIVPPVAVITALELKFAKDNKMKKPPNLVKN